MLRGRIAAVSIAVAITNFVNPNVPFFKHKFSTFSNCAANAATTVPKPAISYISSEVAKTIDVELMSSPGFSIDQLMELAGLSVATAAKDYISHSPNNKRKRVLVLCGPGNNGGDGLVAARHLFHFGAEPVVVCPKVGKADIFANLLKQLEDLDIPVLKEMPEEVIYEEYALIIDALFGFSFSGVAKEPYKQMIGALAPAPHVLSVDIPSGWAVDGGDVHNTRFNPQAVVSLTAPKLCMQGYEGIHYLGGRFVPPRFVSKYNLHLPKYSGADQIVRLDALPHRDGDTQGWTLNVTDEGYPYYYNAKSDTCQWAALQSPTEEQYPPCGSENETENGGSFVKFEKDNKVNVLLSTTSSKNEARTIARLLLKNKLAACVNIVPSVLSMYEWEGKLQEDEEAMMIVKTRKSLVETATKVIKESHDYDVPEVIAFDVVAGNNDYIDWVLSTTAHPESGERNAKP